MCNQHFIGLISSTTNVLSYIPDVIYLLHYRHDC